MKSGIPSRRSNPFATCWLGPLGAPYVATTGNTPAELASRLAQQNWRGQIVGPHGAGKSTLLRALEPETVKRGRHWIEIAFHNRGDRPAAWRQLPQRLSADVLLVIDGFEQLSFWERMVAVWRCWQTGAGLLVTTHRPFHLPVLLDASPDQRTATAVFEQVTAGATTSVTKADALSAFNACNRDMRRMFDKLYDLHEQRIRTDHVANNPHSRRVSNGEPAAAWN